MAEFSKLQAATGRRLAEVAAGLAEYRAATDLNLAQLERAILRLGEPSKR
jgi:hypothetical protein